MASIPVTRSAMKTSSFEEAIERLPRDERFKATIYAMNTLLVQKGIYSPEEFEYYFLQFAKKATIS